MTAAIRATVCFSNCTFTKLANCLLVNTTYKLVLASPNEHCNTSALVADAFLQVNVFIVMSTALRNMSAIQWPGFTGEGAFWFTDLTQPAAVWSTLQCPYGVAGIGLPFALLGLYKFTIDRSPGELTSFTPHQLTCLLL